jgi:hypothetical protein
LSLNMAVHCGHTGARFSCVHIGGLRRNHHAYETTNVSSDSRALGIDILTGYSLCWIKDFGMNLEQVAH